jgi:CRISPR-associated endonuclease Csn1
MDALTVAFTKDAFIQYFNNKNASFTPNSNEYALKTKYFENAKAIPPMPLNEFRAEAKKHLENTLISIKAKNKVVTNNTNKAKNNVTTKIKTKDGKEKIIKGQLVQTPRGQLHLETIYGSHKEYVTKEEKVNASFYEQQIAKVCKQAYRVALLARLQQFDNDPKKAFTGKNALAKNPIWLDEQQTKQVPEKVKTAWLETVYTIRKQIDKNLSVDKVVDAKIKAILK